MNQKQQAIKKIKSKYRLFRRARFKFIRFIAEKILKLWIRDVIGLENIPKRGPIIFISNHLSYYDFLILSAVIPFYITFLAQKKVKENFLIRWFTKFNSVIYIDRDNPGSAFFKKILKSLDTGKSLVVYPEGTRSRTGRMLMPKPGFIKLAMKANVPIIPIAMKGTYEILPPHGKIPKFKRCSVVIGKKMYVSPENPEFSDIFFRRKGERKFGKLTDEEMQEAAIRMMEKIRRWSQQEWDKGAVEEINKIKYEEISVF